MPSDEKVEKVARALCRLHIQNVARYDNPPPSEERIQAGVDNCWQHHEEAARASLAAAEAGEPVAAVPAYLSGHAGDTASTYTPVLVGPVPYTPSEASRDERAAIRKEAFEEAAKIAEQQANEWINGSAATSRGQGYQHGCREAATAIRARGDVSRIPNAKRPDPA